MLARCTPSPFPSPPKHRILSDKPFSGERGPMDAVVVGSDFLAEPEGAAQKSATSKLARRAGELSRLVYCAVLRAIQLHIPCKQMGQG